MEVENLKSRFNYVSTFELNNIPDVVKTLCAKYVLTEYYLTPYTYLRILCPLNVDEPISCILIQYGFKDGNAAARREDILRNLDISEVDDFINKYENVKWVTGDYYIYGDYEIFHVSTEGGTNKILLTREFESEVEFNYFSVISVPHELPVKREITDRKFYNYVLAEKYEKDSK